MVYPSSANSRAQLETLFHKSPKVSLLYQFRVWIKQVVRAIALELTRSPDELHISRYSDIYGQTIWYVYDPMTHERFSTRSEMELRSWIENRPSNEPSS